MVPTAACGGRDALKIVVDGLEYPIVVTTSAAAETLDLARLLGAPLYPIADGNVKDLAEDIVDQLRSGGFLVEQPLWVAAGERSKCWRTVRNVHDHLLCAGAEREALILAIGGGTLTDVAGFAAATYLRGVRWMTVSTTLVGMVDAAIGGKTGINSARAKNLIGAIWQPSGVVAALNALESLPAHRFLDGVAEAVKAAVVGDPSLLEDLAESGQSWGPERWGPVVARAATVKARIVAQDPRERGLRTLLNLGHTFAHAFERASQYRLAHGKAVALGLRASGILARELTGWPLPDHHAMLAPLRRRRAGLRLRGLAMDSIMSALWYDKKRRAGKIRFVLPVRLGEVRAGFEPPEQTVRAALRELESSPGRSSY